MKVTKNGLWGIVALGICALVVVSSMFLPASAQARNIKVGIIDCYSGPAAVYGNDALNGFKMALEEINKEGVLGGKIEFTTRDTKFKPDIALNMAKELVLNEKVDILVGTINSAAALAVSKTIAKEEKIPFIVWISKDEKITGAEGHRYVFSTAENTAMAGKAGGVGLAKKPYKKYWIAGEDYAYGHAIANSVWKNLKALKPEVENIGESWWKIGEPESSSLSHLHHGGQTGCGHFLHGWIRYDECHESAQGNRNGSENPIMVSYGHRSLGFKTTGSRGSGRCHGDYPISFLSP